jgi:hypothetical protein
VAIALGGNLGLVFVLSNPFAGDWKISPQSFEFNNKLLKEFKNDPRIKQYFMPHNTEAKKPADDDDDDSDSDAASTEKSSAKDEGGDNAPKGKGQASRSAGHKKSHAKI